MRTKDIDMQIHALTKATIETTNNRQLQITVLWYQGEILLLGVINEMNIYCIVIF